MTAVAEQGNCVRVGVTWGGPPGPIGEQGVPGPEGAIGPQGAPGAQGVPGSNGAQGIQGPPGNPGSTVVLRGSVATWSALPATGNTVDDGYFVTDIQHIAVWMATPAPAKWVDVGPMGIPGAAGPAGPTGPQGIAGPTGAQGIPGPVGPQGPTVVSADANNIAALGSDGAVLVLPPKVARTWWQGSAQYAAGTIHFGQIQSVPGVWTYDPATGRITALQHGIYHVEVHLTTAANVLFGLAVQPPGGTNQNRGRLANWGGGFDADIAFNFVMNANQFFVVTGYTSAANGYSVSITVTYEPCV